MLNDFFTSGLYKILITSILFYLFALYSVPILVIAIRRYEDLKKMKQSSVFTYLGNLFLLIIISIIFNVVLPVLHIYIYLVMIFLSFLFFLLSLLIKNEDIVEASFFTTGSRRYLLPQIKLKLKNKFLEKLLFVYPKVLLFSAWGIVFLLGFAALLAKQIQNL
ncbi:MAG: hypothetical protein PHO48_04265 [Candidatus Gracilibacteria bacterium]|nr:hypothetical protein [Candidatus Gracilibacteria bacterium]MDD5179129.1 hypothetical protein [Candidatus Gracilibacteria bacterium]